MFAPLDDLEIGRIQEKKREPQATNVADRAARRTQP